MAALDHYTAEITVSVAGREWVLSRAADFDSLWEAMVVDDKADIDDHIPYWTELWPSSLVLCEWLRQQQALIQGKPCLDMGCGIGLTALVATWLGAQVTAMDYEEIALSYAQKNARRNGIQQPLWTVMDWRKPAVAKQSMFRIWGGDIMYERRFVAPVLRFFEHALAKDGKAWLAEPGRSVYDAFLAGLHNGGWKGKKIFTASTEALYTQAEAVTVTVWEISKNTFAQA